MWAVTRLLSILIVLGGLASCASDPATPQDGGQADAHVTLDGSSSDAGSDRDAGSDGGDVFDGGTRDGGRTDGGDGGPDPRRPRHPAIFLSGGGGRTTSAAYRVHLTVGAPKPAGVMVGPNHRLTLGAIDVSDH